MASVSVEVIVVGADGKSKNASGDVDPDASIHGIRDRVMRALRLEGDPRSWIMMVEPRDHSAPLTGYTLRDGDRLYLFKRGVSNPPFKLHDDHPFVLAVPCDGLRRLWPALSARQRESPDATTVPGTREANCGR